MKRRVPNLVLALLIGFAVALIDTPQRIRDFNDPTAQTVDTLIAQDFGLPGAVLYHIVIATLLWTVIAAIPLAVFRRPARPQARSDKSSQLRTPGGDTQAAATTAPPGTDTTAEPPAQQPGPREQQLPTPEKGSSRTAALFVVYVNHPTSRATIHRATCPEYLTRMADTTDNGYWMSTFTSVESASDYARSTGKSNLERCSKCSP